MFYRQLHLRLPHILQDISTSHGLKRQTRITSWRKNSILYSLHDANETLLERQRLFRAEPGSKLLTQEALREGLVDRLRGLSAWSVPIRGYGCSKSKACVRASVRAREVT